MGYNAGDKDDQLVDANGSIAGPWQTDGSIERIPVNTVVDPRPPFCLIYRTEPLLNGSDPDMNVDGSVTPVVYEIKPTVTDEEWFAVNLAFQIEDNGTPQVGQFGNISGGLTNGLKMEFTINGTTELFKLAKYNEQIMMHFTENTHDTGGKGIIGNSGFFQGHFPFGGGGGVPMPMKESLSDKIQITVQDDLTPLGLLRMAVTYWKVI